MSARSAPARRAPAPTAGTTIWLARHGEVHNPEGIFYGRLPRWGLSAEGVRQAEALGTFLAHRPLAAIYSSPMLRARRTAAAIQAHHPVLRVRLDRRLLELKTGWQGRPYTDLDRVNWDFYTHRHATDDDTLQTISARMTAWVARALRRHAGQEVVGVSHGDPILVLVAALHGRPLELASIRPPVYIPTACVYRLSFDPAGRLQGSELFVPHQDAAAA